MNDGYRTDNCFRDMYCLVGSLLLCIYTEGKMKYDLSPCLKCHCMTHSVRVGRANFRCGKCGNDKSLSDVFFYEANTKTKGRKK